MAEKEMDYRVELFNKKETPQDSYNLDNHMHQFKGSSANFTGFYLNVNNLGGGNPLEIGKMGSLEDNDFESGHNRRLAALIEGNESQGAFNLNMEFPGLGIEKHW